MNGMDYLPIHTRLRSLLVSQDNHTFELFKMNIYIYYILIYIKIKVCIIINSNRILFIKSYAHTQHHMYRKHYTIYKLKVVYALPLHIKLPLSQISMYI